MGNPKCDFVAFLNAYHNEVTGSRLLLTIRFPDNTVKHILIDCGYFQEIEYRHLNYVNDLDPRNIDAILITHNHIDHTGLLPKMVKNGYRGPIYMTKITQKLLPKFLQDSCNQQEENCKYLRDKYPDSAYMFDPLYYAEDVRKTLEMVKGVDFNKGFVLFPDDAGLSKIKVTFFENGHILGASMILVECKYRYRKPINFFFTGDYKLTNPFFNVTPIPKLVRNMELIMVHESTYGTTTQDELKICFERNLKEAMSKKMSILIGAFAQGRMQEILLRLRRMEDEGLIPDDYEILVDGPLGLNTTELYVEILKEFNPEMADFLPTKMTKLCAEDRDHVLSQGHPVILVTTSGMLSNGPARIYVPMFLEHKNAMIHLTGYAAEETLARTLLEAKRNETITIGNVEYQKKAIIKTTREMTSHITLDEMIGFINQFKNIRFLAVNHGACDVKDSLIDYVADSCDNVKMTDVLDRKTRYVITQYGRSGEKYSNMRVVQHPGNLDTFRCPLTDGKLVREKKKKKKKKTSRKNKKYVNRKL